MAGWRTRVWQILSGQRAKKATANPESLPGSKPMKLVVGLGNPGRKYRATRHNVGFDVVAAVAKRNSAGPVRGKFQGEVTDIASPAGRVVLLSPTTYMNRSGQSVRAALDFYKLERTDLLVICDDFHLDVGRLRFRAKGSAGGQKGLADIIQKLGGEDFSRLRVGIGHPPEGWNVPDYVLGRFHDEDREMMDAAVQRAAQGVLDWATSDIVHCMNQYNGS